MTRLTRPMSRWFLIAMVMLLAAMQLRQWTQQQDNQAGLVVDQIHNSLITQFNDLQIKQAALTQLLRNEDALVTSSRSQADLQQLHARANLVLCDY